MASFNGSDNPLDFERGCSIPFSLESGLSSVVDTGKRRLSEMRGMFFDEAAYMRALQEGDPVVYAFHSLPLPENAGDLCFGFSILNPGKIGNEYYFTKGHFHTILETGEVYCCQQGHGYMLLESPEGDWSAQEMKKGSVVYVPKRYAHRSINVSDTEQLITFFTFRADAGHNYGTIEEKGYRMLMIEQNGIPTVVKNPRWGEQS